MINRIAPLVVFLLTVVPMQTAAQTALTGTVIDSRELRPVASAEVSLLDAQGELIATTLATPEGAFRFETAGPGVYSINVTRVGYAPLRAEGIPLFDGEETHVEVRMGVDAVPLDAVVVVARELYRPVWLEEFDARAEASRRTGRGRIFTREDIDRIQPNRATDLLFNLQPRRGCTPEILLDGLPADATLSSVRGDELEGVEIYRVASQIPMEYYQQGMCGLVMFWRRPDAPGFRAMTWKRVGITGVVLLLVGLTTAVF